MALPVSNRLLDSLPPEVKADLRTKLEPIPLPLRTPLFASGQTPRYVHFLTSGLSSLVNEMQDGEGVEVGLSGREGLPESVFLLGPQTNASHSFIQVAGTGLRMDFRKFQQEFNDNAAVRRQVLRHVQYESMLSTQLAACNRLHTLEERLARWLLMVAVRIGSLELPLTQEFLALMLGARRSTVTIAAGTLARIGTVEYQRGNIRILDRELLEEAACDCFAVTQKLFDNLYR